MIRRTYSKQEAGRTTYHVEFEFDDESEYRNFLLGKMAASAPRAELPRRTDPTIRRLDGEQRRQRDRLLKIIAEKHFGGSSTWRAANEISRQLSRYGWERWAKDKHATRCPRDIAKGLDGCLWALCQAIGGTTLSQDTVRRALSC